jgi:hypothetical protein
VNNGNEEMQRKKKKKEKEEGKSNGDERVVLEKNYNNFVVIWQEAEKEQRGTMMKIWEMTRFFQI